MAAAQASPLLEVHFEPPLYSGSAQGVPLAGQDGWYEPRPAVSEWLVFTFDDNPFHLPRKPFTPADKQFAGAMAPMAEPAVIERHVDLDTHAWGLTFQIALSFDGAPPPAGEVGAISLEPIGESAGVALLPQWEDRSGLWRASMLVFDAGGAPQFIDLGRGFEGLETRKWYSWGVLTNGRSVIDVWLHDLATGRVASIKPVDWYQGPSEPPEAVRLSAAPAASSEIGTAIDDLMISPRACGDRIDCDHSGQLDFFDFLCFQEAFVAGAPYADFDADGELSFFDFLGFQTAFCCGCP